MCRSSGNNRAVSEHESTSPIETFLRVPLSIAADLVAAFPRLAERTRAQLEFAGTVIDRARCGALGFADSANETLATVVPFDRVAARSVPVEADEDSAGSVASERQIIEVVSVSGASRRPSAAAAPAKKAPAKKAPAKKAPAKKAPAKKAPATPAPVKKAPAKKAPAKKAAATKAPAKKAPAKKAPATTAQAKKAPARKAPAKASQAVSGPVTADQLGIPEYDALAASQVVPRLEALSPSDLELVRRYEVDHRNRQTILGRVSQLQAG